MGSFQNAVSLRGKEGLTRQTYRIQPNERFVRIQLTDGRGKKAWSSPIVFDGHK